MFKRFALIFVSVILLGLVSKADIIVLNDGITMQVHNVEVSPKWIFYTEIDGEDADIKKISIDKVFGYKIGENPMTSIKATAGTSPAVSSTFPNVEQTGKQTPVPAADNDALIAAYNNHPTLIKVGKNPEPNTYTKFFLSLWGVEEGSILSDDKVEIGFEKFYAKNNDNHKVLGTRISVMNKTDNPIYVDLGSSYKIMNGGYSMPYFTNSVFKEGAGSSSGASMNMGGVAGALGIGGAVGSLAGGLTIGSSNNRSSEIETAEQRIISIPPHSRVTLPGEKFSTGKKIIELYEPINFYNRMLSEGEINRCVRFESAEHLTVVQDQKAQKIGDDPKATAKSLNVRKWMQTDFTLDNTPKKIGRIITYSTTPDFSSFTCLPINLYMRGAFGISSNDTMEFFKTPSYDEKNYGGIVDNEHFIVGRGYVKDK